MPKKKLNNKEPTIRDVYQKIETLEEYIHRVDLLRPPKTIQKLCSCGCHTGENIIEKPLKNPTKVGRYIQK